MYLALLRLHIIVSLKDSLQFTTNFYYGGFCKLQIYEYYPISVLFTKSNQTRSENTKLLNFRLRRSHS